MTSGRTVARKLSADAGFVVAAVAAAVTTLWLGRHWSFFYDEWGTVLYRRDGGVESLLAPHNGHLQAVGVGAYRVLFEVVGLRSYLPYQLLAVGAHLAVATGVYLVARRRLGPWVALAAAVPVLLLGEAWEVLFWGVNVSFVVPLVALLLVWAVGGPGALRGAASGGLVLLGLASSGVGVALAVAVGVEAALRRAWWAVGGVAVAAGVYAAWYAALRPGLTTPAALLAVPGALPDGDLGVTAEPDPDLVGTPVFAARAAQAAAFAVVGSHRLLPDPWPVVVAVVLVVAAGARAAAVRSARAAGLLAGAVTTWTLLALARSGQPPNASRYLYVGTVLLVLLAVELAPRRSVPRPVVAALGALAVLAAVQGVLDLRRVGAAAEPAFARQTQLLMRAVCTEQSPASALDPELLPGVTAGPLRAAVEDLGPLEGVRCG